MGEIRETRLVRINERIITGTNLLRLANVIFKEYKNRKKSDKYATISFSATCDDDSVFESATPELFAEESLLNSKRVISVKILFSTIFSNQHIDIHIYHASSALFSDPTSYAEVRGNDSKWVNGTLKLLEEIIDGFAPQNDFLKRYYWLLHAIFAISIGAILLTILGYLSSLAPTSSESSIASGLSGLILILIKKYPLTLYLFLYLFYWLFGFIPALFLMYKLKSLWPSVEIQFGAEHKFLEKRRREWLVGTFLIGVLPLLLQALYDILKTFLK